MPDRNAQIEQEIIRLSHEWMEAVGQRDAAVLDRILAEDFLIAGWRPEGQLCDKKVYIEDCLIPVVVEQAKYTYSGWTVRVYDKLAVAHCLFECHALVGGQPWGGVFLFTDVWAQKEDGWRVVTRHSSPVQSAQDEKVSNEV